MLRHLSNYRGGSFLSSIIKLLPTLTNRGLLNGLVGSAALAGGIYGITKLAKKKEGAALGTPGYHRVINRQEPTPQFYPEQKKYPPQQYVQHDPFTTLPESMRYGELFRTLPESIRLGLIQSGRKY
jgi:hypothetical protein